MASHKNKSRSRRAKNAAAKPWEPTPQQMAIYADAIRGLKSQAEIGREQKPPISQPRVAAILKQIDRWLAPQLMDSVREIKAEHTSRLMHLYSEAMQAWERSKEPAREISRKDSDDGIEVTRRKRDQTGSAAYLTEARACLADIRKIWGADAPLQTDVHLSGEIRVAGKTREEAIGERITALQQSLKVIEVVAEPQAKGE